LIFINQVSGELFSDVINAMRSFPGPHFLLAGSSTRQWSDVRLVKCCGLKKNNSIKRVLTWGGFILQTFFHLLKHARNQHLLIVTNPPMTMWVAPFFKIFFQCRYSILVYDIYPDALIAAGISSKNSAIAALWRKLNAFTLQSAENVITIGHGMAETLQKQMPSGKYLTVSVIENWVDTDDIKPLARSENPIIKELGIGDKFIVAYAGSFGATHGVENIVDCADILRDCSDIHFLLVGGGTEENEMKKHIREKALSNLTVLPFQPKDRFRFIAAAPDVSLILLKAGAGKAIMPSKLYTALSAGTAVLAAAEPDSDLARSVSGHKYGLVISPGDSTALADAVKRIAKDPGRLAELKNNARKAAVKFHAKETQCRKYIDLFR
jgi:glycosyltransferase involved in cell wall biosynthesis